MKILITGANGLVGSHVLKTAEEFNFSEIHATGRGGCRVKSAKHFQYHPCNLTEQKNAETLFESIKPDVVLHSAAMSHVDQCEANKEACWDVNVNATHYLLDAAKRYKAHFTYISTDFVFEGSKAVYNEDDERAPVNFYGESKVAAEDLVFNYSGSKAIVRTILVYGVSESISRSNLILWVKQSLEKKERIKVVKDQFRMATWVGDLACAILQICKEQKNGVYHVSGSQRLSVYEMAIKIADFYGLDASLISPVNSHEFNQHTPRPLSTGFDLSKIQEELGLMPLSFEEGLPLFQKQFSALNPSML